MSALLDALAKLAAGQSLAEEEAHAAVGQVMAGEAPEATFAAFLTALRVKGETSAELAGAVRAVRERMAPWDDRRASPGDPCPRYLRDRRRRERIR